MDKTVKQLADEYGLTKQAMQYHVKKLPKICCYFDTKNGTKVLLVKPEGQDLIHSWLSKKNAEEVAKLYTKEEYLEILHRLELKELENKGFREKLEILEKRSEEDRERLETALRLLDQAQQLQAIAEGKIKMLEQKETEKAAEPAKKSFWKLFFKERTD